MNARSRALVPLSAEQQAAWRAVAETEKRRHQGNLLAEYPYAGAFFRCLNGSEAGHAVREMERWMVPNKLREAA